VELAWSAIEEERLMRAVTRGRAARQP